MKKLAVLLLLVGVLVACQTMKPAVTGYVIGSTTLRQIHDTGVMMEQSGTLTGDRLIQIKKIYNDTRKAWLAAGDVLVVAIQTNDAVLKNEMMAKYDELLTQYNQLANELIMLAADFGILKQMAINMKK